MHKEALNTMKSIARLTNSKLDYRQFNMVVYKHIDYHVSKDCIHQNNSRESNLECVCKNKCVMFNYTLFTPTHMMINACKCAIILSQAINLH